MREKDMLLCLAQNSQSAMYERKRRFI